MKPEMKTHIGPEDAAFRLDEDAIRIVKQRVFLRLPHDAIRQLERRQRAHRTAKRDAYLQRKFDQVDQDL